MTTHSHDIHADHPHEHGPACGHTAVRHGDHVDYLHDGHLHHQKGTLVEEHIIDSAPRIPTAARRNSGTPGTKPSMTTVRDAATNRSPTAITLIISSRAASIILMATIATITGRSNSPLRRARGTTLSQPIEVDGHFWPKQTS